MSKTLGQIAFEAHLAKKWEGFPSKPPDALGLIEESWKNGSADQAAWQAAAEAVERQVLGDRSR